MHDLAEMYERGLGVQRNLIAAYMWLDIAAAQGHEDASVDQIRIESQLSYEDYSKAAKLAVEWVNRYNDRIQAKNVSSGGAIGRR